MILIASLLGKCCGMFHEENLRRYLIKLCFHCLYFSNFDIPMFFQITCWYLRNFILTPCDGMPMQHSKMGWTYLRWKHWHLWHAGGSMSQMLKGIFTEQFHSCMTANLQPTWFVWKLGILMKLRLNQSRFLSFWPRTCYMSFGRKMIYIFGRNLSGQLLKKPFSFGQPSNGTLPPALGIIHFLSQLAAIRYFLYAP